MFGPLLTGFALGYVICNLNPRECPSCGQRMVPVTDASSLPLPDKLAREVNQAIAAGGDFVLEKAGQKAVLWFRDKAGDLFEVATMTPDAAPASALVADVPPLA